jgi:hypothetical protein
MTKDDVEEETRILRGMVRADAKSQSFYLRTSTIDALREQADFFNVSMSALVERAVDRYLKDVVGKK